MRKYSSNEENPKGISILSVVLTYFIPIACGVVSAMLNYHLASADSLLSMLGILAGALIAAFAQLASWREKFSEHWTKDRAHKPERWLLDAAIAHLLAGAYSSVVASLLVIVSLIVNLPTYFPAITHSICSALIIVLGIHVVVSLLTSLPKMYAAYVQLNHVSQLLNGQEYF
ncbi:hypothetical protein [Bifidobacterium callitrichos]|nr:hypothetical protein [Bifidobacterium callitrichos]